MIPSVVVAAREVGPGLLDDVVPEGLTHAFVQRAVADDGDLPGVGRHQHERRVAAVVAVQPEAHELRLGALERVDVALVEHANGDAAAGAGFGGGDGPADLYLLLVRHGLKFTTGACWAPGCAWK